MRQLFKMEYYRLFRNKATYIVLFINLFIVTLQFISRSLPYVNVNNGVIPGYPLSVFEKWIGADTFSMYPTLYFLLVPLLSAIPYCGTLQEDIRTGYIRNVCIKTKKRAYFRVKYIVAFTTGLFSVIPLIFNFLLTATIFPAMLPQASGGFYPINANDMLGGLFYTHPYMYLSVWLIMDVVFFGLLSTLSLAVFFMTNHVHVAIVTPFLVCTTLFGVTWVSGLVQIAPFMFLQPCQEEGASPEVIAVELFLLLAIGVFYDYMAKKQELY